MAFGVDNIITPRYSFFAVHLEPRDEEGIFFDDANTFEHLSQLITLANIYSIKITMQFTPHWIQEILKDENKLNIVKEWERKGHEISAHHHGAQHNGIWDGYSNLPINRIMELRTQAHPQREPEKYHGNMDDYMVVLNKLVSPKTMCMGPDRDTDWPQQIPYSIEGMFNPSAGRPTEKIYNNNKVYELPFKYIGDQSAIEKAKVEYLESQADESIGVVLHLREYVDNMDGVEGWFRFLKEIDPEAKYSKTATWIIEQHFSTGFPTWAIFLLVGAALFMLFGKKK